jgi:hypothetical protein
MNPPALVALSGVGGSLSIRLSIKLYLHVPTPPGDEASKDTAVSQHEPHSVRIVDIVRIDHGVAVSEPELYDGLSTTRWTAVPMSSAADTSGIRRIGGTGLLTGTSACAVHPRPSEDPLRA